MTQATFTARELEQEIIRLGPWHHAIHVTPDVNTRVSEGIGYGNQRGLGTLLDIREYFIANMRSVYPDGLGGRSVLDCGCNCAECLLWAKELGAGDCFGFDAREHWINQARFLLRHYQGGPTDGIKVEICEMYDLPSLDLDPFDVTLFHGVFYHLPDPIEAVRIAAALTKELLVLDTATRAGLPDGLLAIGSENPQALLSGVHGMNWCPTGPEVLSRMLRWFGFRQTTVRLWEKETAHWPGHGRLVMLASKAPRLLSTEAPNSP
jgi:tRNA (mo5U34)-methyltransferase